MTTTDDLFTDVKPPQFFTISRKRACVVCRLVAVCVRDICLACREDLPARLADIQQQQTQHKARLDAATNELNAALDSLSQADLTRFEALDSARITAKINSEKWPTFEARYKATSALQDGLGRIVRAEIAYNEVEPLHNELARLEKAAAAIRVAVAAVDWETVT